jgi:pyruvate formate lyase activating enzyme
MNSFDFESAGRVHSVETLGADDGPGIRMVIFLQGCPMACRYCQNPDTWDSCGGQLVTTGELVRRAIRMRPYFGADGGITLSGGEPLLQLDFAVNLFAAMKSEGFLTALDTSGFLEAGREAGSAGKAKNLLAMTDLVILDVKSPDPAGFRWLTGRDIRALCRFLDILQDAGCATWIRQVVVPSWNDTPEDMQDLADFIARWPRLALEKVELLPYHILGKGKWADLGRPYPLPDVPPLPEAAWLSLQGQIDRLVFPEIYK